MNVPLRHDVSTCGRSTVLRRTRIIFAWLAMSLLMSLLTPHLGAAADKEPPFITGLLDLPLSNYYLTPRGVNVENAGVIFQPLLLLNANLYQSDGPLSNITATVGVWNSIHSKNRSGNAPGSTSTPNWNELDFLSGLSVTLLKDWTFSIGYEYWLSPIDAFPPTSILQLKLAYTDSFLKGFMPKNSGELSLNPYINFFIELHNKSAAAATIEESFYVELGMTPKYVFAGYPLSIELPTYITFPGSDFYSQDSTVGVFGTGVKVTAPLTFIRERYGKWSVHADLVYKYLANDGVVFDNLTALPPHAGTRHPVQFVGGLTLTF